MLRVAAATSSAPASMPSASLTPAAAGTPQSAGTLQWGGAYGHSWFVDPARKMSVVAFTNTTFEGMSGPFTTEVRDASYPPVE